MRPCLSSVHAARLILCTFCPGRGSPASAKRSTIQLSQAGFFRSPLAGRFRTELGTFQPVMRTGHPRAALLSTTTKSSERSLCGWDPCVACTVFTFCNLVGRRVTHTAMEIALSHVTVAESHAGNVSISSGQDTEGLREKSVRFCRPLGPPQRITPHVAHQ